MKFAKLPYVALGIIAATVLLISSCKKEEKSLSFEGFPTFQMDEFVVQGQKMDIFPGEVNLSKSDTKKDRPIGMCYKIGKRPNFSDTLLKEDVMLHGLHVSFPIGDTLGATTFTMYALADGYSSSTSTHNISIVDTTFIGGSLSDMGIKENDQFFKDADGRKYYTTEIAGKTWMKNNYAGGTCGIPYRNSKAMAILFGKYYTWEEAQTVCPEGWHLSTESEWNDMIGQFGKLAGAYMVNATFNLTEKLWPYWPEVSKTNSSGLSAISAGYGYPGNSGSFNFCDYGSYALFWTDKEKDGMGHYKYINVQTPELMDNFTDKNGIRASVRCVKD